MCGGGRAGVVLVRTWWGGAIALGKGGRRQEAVLVDEDMEAWRKG